MELKPNPFLVANPMNGGGSDAPSWTLATAVAVALADLRRGPFRLWPLLSLG